jgi:pimeloyl-ACP methyl ester carboxylesterase
MTKNKRLNPVDFIAPLYMNGLQGRMLRVPAHTGKKREILLIYGHHASLERMFGLAEDLSRYGNVTMPDLPGFGGMEPFYKIGEKPTLDNLAGYLAAFIKLRYKRKRLTLMGTSFGFVVATRMLQNYPELTKKVDLLISVVGFVHRDDFKFKRHSLVLLQGCAGAFSGRLSSIFIRHIVLRRTLIKASYNLVARRHSKFFDAGEEERKKRIEFEVYLWQCNDVRTYINTSRIMFNLDLCDKQVPLKLYHIAVAKDRYFDNDIVEQHLNVVYDGVEVLRSVVETHAPTVVADAKTAAPFVPKKIRRLLAKTA